MPDTPRSGAASRLAATTAGLGAQRPGLATRSKNTSHLEGHEGQLARYFNAVQTVSLGILTNGIEYRFYTDSAQPNLIDPKPFWIFRTDAIDRRLDILQRFTRAQLNADALRDFATEMFFTAIIVGVLRNELDLRGRVPSESFVRWILASEGVYEGRVMASVVDRFRPIVASALQTVLRDIIRRSVAALDQGIAEPETPQAPVTDDPLTPATPATPETRAAAAPSEDDAAGARGPITTERELKCFELIAKILSDAGRLPTQIVDPGTKKSIPAELGYKDTTAYFGVYFTKVSWWFVRLFVEARQPWIGFNLPASELRRLVPPSTEIIENHAHSESGIKISSPEDLLGLKAAILAAADAVLAARRA